MLTQTGELGVTPPSTCSPCSGIMVGQRLTAMTWPKGGVAEGQSPRAGAETQGAGQPSSSPPPSPSQDLRKGGLEPLLHCTGRSSIVTLATTGACGQAVEERQTEELPV